MGRDNVKNNLVDEPIYKISEFAVRKKFPENFTKAQPHSMEINGVGMIVTEPLVDFYVNTGVIDLICEIGAIGRAEYKRAIVRVDDEGKIKKVISQGREVDMGAALGYRQDPEFIKRVGEIGSKFYQKMKPMMDERERVRAEIYKLVAELIPTLNS